MLNPTTPETTAPETGRLTASKNSVAIALLAIAFFLANVIARFPSLPNFDSDLQYAQPVSGHFTDWQPPIMAWLRSGWLFSALRTLLVDDGRNRYREHRERVNAA